MTVASTQSSTATTATSTPLKTTGKSTLGNDDFLKLLVAQLKYQDPLNPADGTAFVAQTAQLTSVEKLTALSKTTEDAYGLQQKWSSASLVGRQVSYAAADGSTVTGTVQSVTFSGPDPVLKVRSGGATAPTTTDVTLSNITAVSAAA